MTEQLDCESMVIALTNGVGAQLGGPIRASFFELAERLCSHKSFAPLHHDDKQALVDLLALSIFYNQVISPLESSSHLLALAQKAQATHIRLGSDKLTPSLTARFGACAGSFQRILREQHISTDLMSFSTLKEFIANYMSAKDRPTNEAVD